MNIFQFMFVIQTKKILEKQNVDCFAFKQLKSIINDIIFHLQRKIIIFKGLLHYQ